jgi:hypothetical protein
MSVPYHGSDEEMLRSRLLDQYLGVAKRAYPKGRMGADDDGELAYAIAVDARHQVIRVEFGKPITWIGLDREAAEKLRDVLTDGLLELRGISPVNK